MAEAAKKQRVSVAEMGLMIAVAIVFDLIDLAIDLLSLGTVGAIISPFLTVFAYLIFGFWFLYKGIPIGTPKNFIAFNGSLLIELIPYLGDLPVLTGAVVRILIMVRLEDTTGLPLGSGGDKKPPPLPKTTGRPSPS
jgi:hypothetical protein